eukprot:1142602-Pelagomonas_calceolata.AAC.3
MLVFNPSIWEHLAKERINRDDHPQVAVFGVDHGWDQPGMGSTRDDHQQVAVYGVKHPKVLLA